MKLPFRCLIGAICAFCLLPAVAHAGAWPQPKGGGQVIVTTSHYATTGFFDADGKRRGQNGGYQKDEINLFAEYGLTEDVTLGIQPSYQWVQTRGGAGTQREDGLADTAFYLRERVWHDDDNVFSLQQLVTVPGPYERNDPAALGYGQSDLELRGLFGHGGKVKAVPYFVDFQAAFRKRFDDPADEMRMDITAGLKPEPGWMILAQSFNTIGMRNASDASFVTASGPDYDLAKIRLSGVVDITDTVALQFGAEADVYGRNTGAGKTLFIGIWRSF